MGGIDLQGRKIPLFFCFLRRSRNFFLPLYFAPEARKKRYFLGSKNKDMWGGTHPWTSENRPTRLTYALILFGEMFFLDFFWKILWGGVFGKTFFGNSRKKRKKKEVQPLSHTELRKSLLSHLVRPLSHSVT